ncbi:MAG: hypothetical protein GY793_06110 [Proteobacteria bacterium]|nr:hypothetical protein [Pseudomonadota bacterium]
MSNKRAAMFGLDARVALAIFAALSGITGAALYDAIQNAKATAYLVDLQEIGKAWESYYLDMGTNPPPYNTTTFLTSLNYDYLTTPVPIAGWDGPYINERFFFGADNEHVVGVGQPRLNILNNDIWDETTRRQCTAGNKCSIWVSLDFYYQDFDSSIAKKIDFIVDRQDNPDSGDFRWHSTSRRTTHIYLKIAPTQNPND